MRKRRREMLLESALATFFDLQLLNNQYRIFSLKSELVRLAVSQGAILWRIIGKFPRRCIRHRLHLVDDRAGVKNGFVEYWSLMKPEASRRTCS